MVIFFLLMATRFNFPLTKLCSNKKMILSKIKTKTMTWLRGVLSYLTIHRNATDPSSTDNPNKKYLTK
jgi:hypothetical protein